MTLGFTYDVSALTHKVAPSNVSLASGAEVGNPLTSSLVIEDPAGDLTLLGHRPFVVEESACSQPRLFTGWTTERGIGRAYDAGPFGNSTARVHDMSIIDLNALFHFRIISGTDGKRPEETSNARLAWLLGSSYLSGLIADTGFVISNTRVMDAADYRTRYPADVMSDLMDRAVALLNYFAFWDATAGAVGLWLNYTDVALGDSTLRISNVLSDADSVTFPPEDDSKPLSRQPENVFSEVVYEYAHGTKRLFRSRASTAAKYIRRGTTLERPWTGKLTTARNQAEAFLNQHANELDRITVTIVVPRASVGLVTVGQRMDVKYSNLPGYTTFTSMRTVMVRYRPTDDTAAFYFVDLELVAPRVTTSSGGSATIVQTASGVLGGTPRGFEFPLPTTVGNVLLFMCSQRGGGPVTLTGANTPETWTTVIQNGYGYGNIVAIAKVADGVVDHVDAPSVHDWVLVLDTSASIDGTGWCMWELAGVDITTLVSAVSAGDATGSMSISIIPEAGGEVFEAALFNMREEDDAVYETHTVGTAGSGWTKRFSADTTYSPDAMMIDRIVTAPNGTDAYPATGTRSKYGGWAGSWEGIVVALGGPGDVEIDLPPTPGTTILSETPTPAPDGTTVLFTLASMYQAGSLRVWVDGIPIPGSEVAETDPGAGTFTLSWAPDADEAITVMYLVG